MNENNTDDWKRANPYVLIDRFTGKTSSNLGNAKPNYGTVEQAMYAIAIAGGQYLGAVGTRVYYTNRP